jgi:hypothetical protein
MRGACKAGVSSLVARGLLCIWRHTVARPTAECRLQAYERGLSGGLMCVPSLHVSLCDVSLSCTYGGCVPETGRAARPVAARRNPAYAAGACDERCLQAVEHSWKTFTTDAFSPAGAASCLRRSVLACSAATPGLSTCADFRVSAHHPPHKLKNTLPAPHSITQTNHTQQGNHTGHAICTGSLASVRSVVHRLHLQPGPPG